MASAVEAIFFGGTDKELRVDVNASAQSDISNGKRPLHVAVVHQNHSMVARLLKIGQQGLATRRPPFR